MADAGGADRPRALSIFDLDRTLTRRPTYLLFLLGGAARTAPHRLLLLPTVAGAMIAHKAGLVGRKPLKQIMQRLLLGARLDEARTARLVDRFVGRLVAEGLYPAGLARIAADRAEGRAVLMATAAPDYYANAIAERLGLDAAISTRCRRDADGLSARIDGANCYGPAKLAAIRDWMAGAGVARDGVHVRFYSDDRSDLPAFEWADEPVVVNARPRFARWARRRGWRVEDWRSR